MIRKAMMDREATRALAIRQIEHAASNLGKLARCHRTDSRDRCGQKLLFRMANSLRYGNAYITRELAADFDKAEPLR